METTSTVSLINNDTVQTEPITIPSRLKTLGSEDRFICSNHENISSADCKICKGLGHVSGNNNFVKFVESVLEFKLGLKKG